MEQIESFRRIGKKAGNRPVLVTLNAYKLKKLFFDNLVTLKSKGYNVANDITKEEREIYRKLKEIKEELLYLGIESKIIKSKILIKNEFFEIEEAYNYIEKKRRE